MRRTSSRKRMGSVLWLPFLPLSLPFPTTPHQLKAMSSRPQIHVELHAAAQFLPTSADMGRAHALHVLSHVRSVSPPHVICVARAACRLWLASLITGAGANGIALPSTRPAHYFATAYRDKGRVRDSKRRLSDPERVFPLACMHHSTLPSLVLYHNSNAL